MKYIKSFAIMVVLFSCSSQMDNNLTEKQLIDSSKTEISQDKSYIEKFSNGKIKVSGEIVKGKREGKWFSYFENGTKQSEHNYLNGKLHGNMDVFSLNGKLLYQGFYLHGKQHGKWIYYERSSKENKEVWYENGVKK